MSDITNDSIYGEHLENLIKVKDDIIDHITLIRHEVKKTLGMDPVEHCLSRIKRENSMREKCRRNNLPETTESALTKIFDAIGIRIVCAFIDDVYTIRDCLKNSGRYEIINEKDYIANAKPNGYRSYHMIIKSNGYYAEIQIRTISMDTWAALEHHLKYKKDINKEQEPLIEAELKRCADELASTDLSMQTIRDMIMENQSNRLMEDD